MRGETFVEWSEMRKVSFRRGNEYISVKFVRDGFIWSGEIISLSEAGLVVYVY